MNLTFEPVRTDAEIAETAALAHAIWHEYYVPLIGLPQVEYMVGKFQSTAAIAAQIRDGYEYFLATRGTRRVGYAAIRHQSDALFISKLYVQLEERGSGTGRAMMAFIEASARQRGCRQLWLTVNKGNPAIRVYERLGFAVVEAVVMDIGAGFVMDDYRMEKSLY